MQEANLSQAQSMMVYTRAVLRLDTVPCVALGQRRHGATPLSRPRPRLSKAWV